MLNFYPFKRGDNKTFGLKKGTQIKLLDGMPPYEVANIVTTGATPALILKLLGPEIFTFVEPDKANGRNVTKTIKLPEVITIKDSAPFPIGRGIKEGERGQYIGIDSISREHLSIYFDSHNKQFVMTSNNTNAGYIANYTSNRTIGQQTYDESAQTTDRNLKDPNENENREAIPLRYGMTLQLLPIIPPYKVTRADSNPALLRLEIDEKHKNRGYNDVITVTSKSDSIILGRGEKANYNFTQLDISRHHATLAWDEGQQSFIYSPGPKSKLPIVGLPEGFIRDMEAICAQIQPRSLSTAREQIAAIDALVTTIEQSRQLMEAVQFHEVATQVTPERRRGDGAMTEDAQRGYSNWLQAYRLLYQEHLPVTDKVRLDNAVKIVDTMAQDRRDLRKIQTNADFKELPAANYKAILAKVQTANYNEPLERIVERQCEKLRKDPQISYVVSGLYRHHTVTKIEKDHDGYMVTTYNAGADSRLIPNQPGKVMGMYKQRLLPDVKIEDFIRLLNELKICPDYRDYGEDARKIKSALNSMLGPVLEFRPEPPQGKGNCTTRSTREMLKDVLGMEVFTHLHKHVSNPEVCDPAAIMAALQMRRAAFQRYLIQHGEQDIPLPGGQRSWADSIPYLSDADSRAKADATPPSGIPPIGR